MLVTATSMEYEILFDDGREKKVKIPAKYPNAKKVFRLWGTYPFPWNVNAPFLNAAEWLFKEKGIEELSELFKWYRKHQEDKFCPKFHDPMSLMTQYPKLEAHLARTS